MAKPSDHLDWTDGAASKQVEPSGTKKLAGWLSGEKPPFQFMNWLFYFTDLWNKHFEAQIDAEHNVDGPHSNITADSILIKGAITATQVLGVVVTSDTFRRWYVAAGGDQFWGTGNATQDLKLSRTDVRTLILNDNNGSTASVLFGVLNGIIQSNNPNANDTAMWVQVISDNFARLAIKADGQIEWSTGATNPDLRLRRSDIRELTLDDTNDGAIGCVLRLKRTLLKVENIVATELILRALLTADANNRFSIDTEGLTLWGNGTDAQDVRLYRNAARQLLIDDNNGATLPVILSLNYGFFRSVNPDAVRNAFALQVSGDAENRWLITSNGNMEWSDGTNPQDLRIYRSAAKTITFDDTAGGALTEAKLLADKLSIQNGYLNLSSGQYVYQPDVSGGAANSGRFTGGNGGFMWFDGNITTDVTLDSTLDWRDRWISVKGFVKESAPNYIPGGSSDHLISGHLLDTQQVAPEHKSAISAMFYSEAGQNGSSENPGVRLSEGGTLIIHATTSGDLRIQYNDIGPDYSYGLLIMFSDDQGHY